MFKTRLLLIFAVLHHLVADAQFSTLQWTFGMGGTGNSPSYVNEVWSVHTNEQGVVTAGGTVAGMADLDPSGGVFMVSSPAPTLFNGFVARYDSSRNFLDGFVLASTGDSYAKKVTRDASDNLFVAGEFILSMEADPGPGIHILTSVQSGRDMFLAKYDSAHTLLYAFSIGGDLSTDFLNNMVCDDAGNVYITGEISDTVDFVPGPAVVELVGTPGGTFFVAKYTPAGALDWVFAIEDLNSTFGQSGHGLCFDPAGNILVSMRFRGIIDVDPSPAQVLFDDIGAGDLVVARYTTQGVYVNAWQLGGPGGVSISESAIACDPQGFIALGARFTGTLDVDPGTSTTLLSSVSTSSVLIGRYTLAGQLRWAKLAGLLALSSNGVDVDSIGAVYVLSSDINNQGRLSKLDTSGTVVYTKSLTGNSGLYARALYVRHPDAFHLGGGYKGGGFIDGTLSGGGSGYAHFLAQFGACLVPEIQSQSTSTLVCDSADVVFTVYATGSGIVYQWYRDGVLLVGDTLDTLTLVQTDSSDNGTYHCVVSGLCGTDTSAPIGLSVSPYPQVSILVSGNQLQAIPAGLSQYQWLLNNQATGISGNILNNPAPGLYAVIGITAAGCADTSFAVAVTTLQDVEIGRTIPYPNPVEEFCNFFAEREAAFELLAPDGRMVLQGFCQPGWNTINVQDCLPGLYLLRMAGVSQDRSYRIMKR
ncbi:MAG: hypothetical protein ACKOQY_01935 [Bacteroidota bacterium]